MKWNRTILPAVGAAAWLMVVSPQGAMAQGAGKVFAKIGDWQVKRFPKYCVASIGFEGDRGLRIHSGSDSFSFGFMGAMTAVAGPKTPVTYWFDKMPKQNRTAVKRINQNEDGGAPWLIFVDPAKEPSHAGDFESAKTVTFAYKINGQAQTETYQLKGANVAFRKLFECSGQ